MFNLSAPTAGIFFLSILLGGIGIASKLGLYPGTGTARVLDPLRGLGDDAVGEFFQGVVGIHLCAIDLCTPMA